MTRVLIFSFLAKPFRASRRFRRQAKPQLERSYKVASFVTATALARGKGRSLGQNPGAHQAQEAIQVYPGYHYPAD
jgi:hypothetical protein